MFPCDGYLQLAKELAIKGDEASQRSAVSRAYYASLHGGMIFAQKNNRVFSSKGKPEIHGEVKEYFIYSGNTSLMLLGNKLDKLRKSRNDCDYENHVQNPKKEAENAVMYAEEIFNSLN